MIISYIIYCDFYSTSGMKLSDTLSDWILLVDLLSYFSFQPVLHN